MKIISNLYTIGKLKKTMFPFFYNTAVGEHVNFTMGLREIFPGQYRFPKIIPVSGVQVPFASDNASLHKTKHLS